MHRRSIGFAILVLSLASTAPAQPDGAAIYRERCLWCHGEEGGGDGPAATRMRPPPRDFVRAAYKVRSTPFGQLPTDEDLFRVISDGIPATPMPAWKKVLTEGERRALVEHLKTFSPRFQDEPREPLAIPSAPASAERGEALFNDSRCTLCHGERGRGDGQLTTTLDFEWGQPHAARDFTRASAFKGGHRPEDVYLRITGGLHDTPMGSYRDLLTDEERWDLAHYVVGLDQERAESAGEFTVIAALLDGEIPGDADAPEWERAAPLVVRVAPQISEDPPHRWWTATARTVTVRALWNRREIAFRLTWNDATEPSAASPDSAFLQFAARPGETPALLLGDAEHAVRVWHWRNDGEVESWTAEGAGSVETEAASFRATARREAGRWRVVFRRGLDGDPAFAPGRFVPVLFSVRDGANGETGEVRALSTWMYATLAAPPTARPWLIAVLCLLTMTIAELWLLSRISR